MNDIVTTYKQPNSHKTIKSVSKYDMTERVKQEYVNFINTTYQPTHFLTVRLPQHWETTNLSHAKDRLRLIMKVFERKLLGTHWNKHHLPFIVTSEKGESIYWHFHILFNQQIFTDRQLEYVRKETVNTIKRMSDYCLVLDKIGEKNKTDKILTFVEALHNTNFYCVKEIRVDRFGRFDSSGMIFSADLFNLPYKNALH